MAKLEAGKGETVSEKPYSMLNEGNCKGVANCASHTVSVWLISVFMLESVAFWPGQVIRASNISSKGMQRCDSS